MSETPIDALRQKAASSLAMQLWITLPQVPVGRMPSESQMFDIVDAVLSVTTERIAELESQLAAARRNAERYQQKCHRQRRELRRLNKYLGPYWTGFRRGMASEGVCNLRRIMMDTFGHKAVLNAEHAAVDRALQAEGRDGK